MNFKARVYIACPYTKGDPETNVANAIDAANALADLGYAPMIPVLTHFWELRHKRDYEFWMALDFAFLPICDALIRLPGESSGADREIERAMQLGIPVFYSFDELDHHFGKVAA